MANISQKSREHWKNLPFTGPYLKPCKGKFSGITQKIINQILKRFCNNEFNIKIVFFSFKTRLLFGRKDHIPRGLRTLVVYRFTCTSCGACYVRKISQHLDTRINKNLKMDKALHIYKYLMVSEGCRQKCSPDCFSILDQSANISQLKIKEAIHILWEKP